MPRKTRMYLPGIPAHVVQRHDIRECLACNYPLGIERFREEIEAALGRRVGERKRGRPLTRDSAAQN
jgi:hypothetical protein